MGLIEKLRAKQREFDRKRWPRYSRDSNDYDVESVEMADLLGCAINTIEGQALLIDQAQQPA